MSTTQFLEVSIAFALLLLLEVTVAEKVNKYDNVEDLAEISGLAFATSGDRYKTYRYGSKVLPQGMSSRSGIGLDIPSGQECSNYTNLTNPDRAQRAVTFDQQLCDRGPSFVPGWYRFTGEAGDKMASTCVPIVRCTTASTGWLNGSHPTANSSLARRRVCFHWKENCCYFEVYIWVRHCGDFYIYQLPWTPVCNMRYCGNAVGPMKNPSHCGGDITNLTGQITSPGYPNYMEPISCHWTIKSPLDGNILLYFEDMTLSHEGCPSNNITIVGNRKYTYCRKSDHRFHLFIAKQIVDIYYQSVYWNKISGFKIRYAIINESLENVTVISKWNISVQVNTSSEIHVSWQALDSSSLRPNEYVYGYVVVCKPTNQRSVYVLTGPDAATISITGLIGGTEYKVQVVALVNKRNAMSSSLYGSVIVKTSTNKGECTHFNYLTTWDRSQGAPGGPYCDQWNIITPAWYRFAGRAGTQIASSCVPKSRCGTAAPGWMDGAHPTVQEGIVVRPVCFHWFEDCCKWQVNIKVRNCGGFYVYRLQRPPLCDMRYCGNEGTCGKSFNDTTGTLTSPGYPNRIFWDSKCQWNFTAPSPSGAIVVIVEHLSLPLSARCLKFSLSFENDDGKQVGKVCGVQRFFTWVSQGSAVLRFFSERAASRWVGFKARYFIFKNDLTQIPDIPQWTIVSAQPNNSTAITVRWNPYPTLVVSSPVTEYLIICVPDGLPLNATVFTTDVSQTSLIVTGLLKYTNYKVQVVIQTNGNISSFNDYRRSQSTTVRTKEDVPSEGPQSLTTMATGTTITVSWQPIPEHARHGKITSYVIYFKKAWTSDSYSNKMVGSTDRKALLKELEPVTEYRIEMAGATSVGVGTKSRAVFSVTECKISNYASKNHLTWTFTSPRYPNHYPSNVDCTWSVYSNGGEKMYIVFDEFHLEKKTTKCSDYVTIVSNDVTNQSFCGKRDPFAVKLTSQSGDVKFKSDGGLEESGFHARVFVVKTKMQVKVKFLNNGVIYNNTLEWLEPNPKLDIIEYVVLYSEHANDVWKASITNTTKAILTGLDQEKYIAILLFRTSSGQVYFATTDFKLPEPTVTGPPTTTAEPPIMQSSTVYPYGDNANDEMVPNTAYYSTRCFPIKIPDDGIQFYAKRHYIVYICRNGLLLFETSHLIHWPYRFSEQRPLLNKTDILAPYWAITDVHEAFVTSNTSKVYYKVYYETEQSKPILRQATYDVQKYYVLNLAEKFEATWVLKVTWSNLRFPGAKKLSPIPENTFQAVLITNGVYSFAMYNYPRNGIQWSAPTQKKNYKYFTVSRGLPVVGLNLAEHNLKQNYFYDVPGSGTVGIDKVDELVGLTIYAKSTGVDKIEHKSPRKWFFRLETIRTHSSSRKNCINWFKLQPDPRTFTEHLEPCPCTYRQAIWDERFYVVRKGWSRVCAYLVFESEEGWNQECCYDRMTGALIKGYPGGGTPQLNYNKRPKKAKIGNNFLWCCVLSPMCHLYYEKRPSNNCTGYKETEWSWLWGDPHFVTLDGLNYTFNGLGEYIMADISNGLFQLQARTKLVEGGGKATVFVSAVAKQTGSSAVQVNLKPGEGLELLVNGSVVDHTTLTNASTRYNGSVALSRPDNTSIIVLYPSGVSVKMTDVRDSLVILLAAPEKFKNKTRGLLGVWNGDPEDDLTTPSGRIVPTNATGRTLHYEFGQKWQVTENTSLFTYKQGENVNTFSNSSFEPMFIEDFKFANETLRQEALEKCDGDLNCLFDAALTNDVIMGTSTKIVGSRLKNESKALKNSVPKFINNSSTFFVMINTTARIELFAKDNDDDTLTFNVSGILPETLDINTDSGRSVAISWEVAMDKIKLEVTVMDDKGAVALLRPEVHVCACHHGGYCSSDSSNNVFADSTNDTFFIMPCTCIHGYTGRFCENDLDACQANLNPCYPGVKCTDLPPPAGVFGYRCGHCPRGFTGDGATCLDLDECESGNDGCSQICVNTPGSFVCDCNPGYRLDIDQKTCNDVDECLPSSDCMQKCKNTLGNYTCECYEGFKVDPKNRKKCVAKLPCADGNHGCQDICYMKDGQQQCACKQGYELKDDQKTCQDVDECSTRKYRCNQYCHNNEGSYSCSCKKGFRMNNDGVTCVDVDECMELTYQCTDPSQICLNTAGSYKCVCGPGLYLTANNTCREILPGHTTPSPGPAPTPKSPTANQKDNAVRIIVEKLHISEWNENVDMKFKRSVAKAVTSFCASKDEECKETRKRERRSLDYIPYTADQVHLLPEFPKRINLESRDIATLIAFYVEFPPEVVSTSGDSIKGGVLVEIVRSDKVNIEKSLNRTISSITLDKKEGPLSKNKSEKLNIYVIIGASLAGVLFISIVGVCIRRDLKRNATLRIKRNQEKEERRTRASNVNNACYDDGILGEFRLAPAQSSTEILEGTGNEYVQAAELGIDNLEVNVK